jgi:hypothetical protein
MLSDRMRRTFWTVAVAAAGILVPPSAGYRAQAGEVLLRAGFEGEAAGWRKVGKADFSLDTSQSRSGKKAARITVLPAEKLQWQQWQYDVAGIAAGDTFAASVWVRTKDLADGTGAYFVLEYLDAGGTRCGIDHSRVSLQSGRNQWQKLAISGHANSAAKTLRVGLVLYAHGTAWFDDLEVVRTERLAAWPDLGAAERVVTIHGGQVVQGHFRGVGYHVFHHVHPVTSELFDQVVGERWREVNPSFARMNHNWDWSPDQMETAARHMAFFRSTGTELYLTTWNPKETKTEADRAEYARLIVDQLEYLKCRKGLTNLKYYCMTNELTLRQWGSLADDLPAFRDYHRAIFKELQARKLDVQLLATDASPIDYWQTIEWAARNMDEITGIYGGHHYVNDRSLDDERFYPWFLEKVEWAVGIARNKHKDFILGEFGSKQDGRRINGEMQDRCVYFDTPEEPLMPIQISEAAIAAINAGAYALGYWTFMDFPDMPGAGYCNKWGLFKWSGNDHSTRPVYYAYGLLSKFFRGPAAVYRIDSNDPRLRVAAVEHQGTKTWSIAVVSRNKTAVPFILRLDDKLLSGNFRKYVYDPAQAPSHPFGDLPGPAGNIRMQEGRLTDRLAPGALAVYTTAYDDEPPGPVSGLKVTRTQSGKSRLEWQPNPEADLCYYRVYRTAGPDVEVTATNQIASTIATSFVDEKADPRVALTYKVIAVDQSGNAGK